VTTHSVTHRSSQHVLEMTVLFAVKIVTVLKRSMIVELEYMLMMDIFRSILIHVMEFVMIAQMVLLTLLLSLDVLPTHACQLNARLLSITHVLIQSSSQLSQPLYQTSAVVYSKKAAHGHMVSLEFQLQQACLKSVVTCSITSMLVFYLHTLLMTRTLILQLYIVRTLSY